MQASMTAQLVADALVMAVWRRGKPDALLQLDQVELSYRRQLEATELCGLGVVGAINHRIEGCWRDEQRK